MTNTLKEVAEALVRSNNTIKYLSSITEGQIIDAAEETGEMLIISDVLDGNEQTLTALNEKMETHVWVEKVAHSEKIKAMEGFLANEREAQIKAMIATEEE